MWLALTRVDANVPVHVNMQLVARLTGHTSILARTIMSPSKRSPKKFGLACFLRRLSAGLPPIELGRAPIRLLICALHSQNNCRSACGAWAKVR